MYSFEISFIELRKVLDSHGYRTHSGLDLESCSLIKLSFNQMDDQDSRSAGMTEIAGTNLHLDSGFRLNDGLGVFIPQFAGSDCGSRLIAAWPID
ncbi:MAG: hypothetical protein IPP85_14255 [Propionivibrio sp.]|nr:hypothetical protein [Propionivibrio sp.]